MTTVYNFLRSGCLGFGFVRSFYGFSCGLAEHQSTILRESKHVRISESCHLFVKHNMKIASLGILLCFGFPCFFVVVVVVDF